MGTFGAVSLAMGMLTGQAQAGPFTPKSSQGDWNAIRSDRGFVLPKGWLQVGFGIDHKSSTAYRGADGGLRQQPKGMLWQHSKLWLEVEQGFSRRVTLYGRVPVVRSSLQPASGNEVTTVAMGDAHAGFRVQPVTADWWDTAVSLDLKVPSGVEWPAGTGGPGNTESFLTGTGITNLGLHVHGAVRLSGLMKAMSSVGYVRKFPGIVGYVTATEGFGNGVIDPGDEWVSETALVVNPTSYAAISLGARVRAVGLSEIGTNTDGVRRLSPVQHSSGTWVDGRAQIALDATEHWSIEAGATIDRAGGDTRPFAHLGLEELSPQPGVQWSGRLVMRS